MIWSINIHQGKKDIVLMVDLLEGKGVERLHLENTLSITPYMVASQGLNLSQ